MNWVRKSPRKDVDHQKYCKVMQRRWAEGKRQRDPEKPVALVYLKPSRVCKTCKTVLSTFNKGDVCFACKRSSN